MKLHYFVVLILITAVSCKKDTTSAALNETDPPVLTANYKVVNKVINGYYSGLPAHYKETDLKYPLLLSLHGGGQLGNDSADLPSVLRDGVPKLLQEKTFPPSFVVKGERFSFITLAPQFSSRPSEAEVYSFLEYAIQTYRVDVSRIYVTGLSMGGIATCDLGAAYPGKLAAIVPIAGVSGGNDISQKCSSIANANLPIWALHNNMDEVNDVQMARDFIETLVELKPATAPKYSEFTPAGAFNHDAWTRATHPSYKENGMNIYEWMLQYKR